MAERCPVPDCLTIEEAARVLRMGRTAGYEQARIFRETNGRAGLPNFAMGGTIRVPTAALETMLGRPVTAVPAPKRSKAAQAGPTPVEERSEAPGAEVDELRSRGARQARRRPPAGGAGHQTSLAL